MDPYFRPILISSLGVLILNEVLILPIISTPIVTYFLGGIAATFLYIRQFKDEEKGYELKVFDTTVLGLGTGSVAGSILALIFAVKMQNEEAQNKMIELVNQATLMQGNADLEPLTELTPGFIATTAIVVIVVCAAVSFFGSLCTLPFFKKRRK